MQYFRLWQGQFYFFCPMLTFINLEIEHNFVIVIYCYKTHYVVLIIHYKIIIPGDSGNSMPPILVPSSAKRIATQILLIAKLNGRKDFILRAFVCDIIHCSKELPV